MALNMLSIGTVSEMRSAIAAGDVKFIQAANGVGKKVAERTVIELKDKVGIFSPDGVDGLLVSTGVAQKDEAVQALVALGFNVQDAIKALQGVDSSLPPDQRVKLALKVGV